MEPRQHIEENTKVNPLLRIGLTQTTRRRGARGAPRRHPPAPAQHRVGDPRRSVRRANDDAHGNGSNSCNGSITTHRDNPDTLIANNLIYGNGRNGISFHDATGGPHQIVGNTIHANPV